MPFIISSIAVLTSDKRSMGTGDGVEEEKMEDLEEKKIWEGFEGIKRKKNRRGKKKERRRCGRREEQRWI
jgi:hypothetical protein